MEGNLANSIRRNDLSRVAMPIIRVMIEGELSWAQKIECADALQKAVRHHKSMENERQIIEQAACMGQQAA